MDVKISFKGSTSNSARSSPKSRSVGALVVLDCFTVTALVPKELAVSVRIDDDGATGPWRMILGRLCSMLWAQ